MDTLFAPWRMEYILGPKADDCVFCIPESTATDSEGYVLVRGTLCFVIMNRYPYANGHLMVAPFRHVPDLTDLDDRESAEMMYWIRGAVQALRQALNPEGFNVGVNLGDVAGAGIQEHLHVHVVPRWHGDTSFMTVCGHTRVVPEHLSSTYARLAPLFVSLSPSTLL
ncbi:Diadenosine tetraphosphate (Ap4A) hydrolase [Desulfonatronum thiosulfatophilum]|uniref:Diadenosine tetraphosphate (Ap4A) hydrolase n=1 Tax=Desulfonatronum thiosulfatophilum TaxID=617002 RepID=A0A1G6CIH7_9BACT|nr:HIT domain-containing protein [Desulfonatronum thiosulfatophilum]SDB32703.1 Diadenosine tetraphosphate (Ap4A) hydrolase [Desulfonatronum thiosulfatophilum]